MKLIHYIQLVLGILAMVLPSIAERFPASAPTLAIAAQICTAVLAAMGPMHAMNAAPDDAPLGVIPESVHEVLSKPKEDIK